MAPYLKSKELLKRQLVLANADQNGRLSDVHKDLKYLQSLLQLEWELRTVSPVMWIEQLQFTPTNAQIAAEVKKLQLTICKKYRISIKEINNV